MCECLHIFLYLKVDQEGLFAVFSGFKVSVRDLGIFELEKCAATQNLVQGV